MGRAAGKRLSSSIRGARAYVHAHAQSPQNHLARAISALVGPAAGLNSQDFCGQFAREQQRRAGRENQSKGQDINWTRFRTREPRATDPSARMSPPVMASTDQPEVDESSAILVSLLLSASRCKAPSSTTTTTTTTTN